ncbi:MAG: tRNA (adenosine(37)-N6)-threonylcarbamoyltransferase complex dimerization subunit type 1 TsaB [Spirochaetales bacterium]
MNLLGIDTTKKQAHIALFLNGEGQNFFTPNDASHSESLLPRLNEVLETKAINLDAFDTYAVVIGPGSFTGIRIGVSLVKAFMYGNTKKCVAVNFFDLIANSIDLKNSFVIALNADNRGCYVAEYTDAKVLKKIELLTLENLKDYLNENGLPLFVTEGDYDYFVLIKNRQIANVSENALIEVAKRKYDEGKFTLINELEPLYLKLSQAEDQYKEKVLSQIKIERATLSDLDELVNLEKQIFLDEAYNMESLKDELTLENRYFWVVRFKEHIVAYLDVLKSEDDFNILKIASENNYKKLGLATKLYEVLLNEAKNLGVKKIFLEVNEHNTPAISFYKKQGLVEEHIRKNYYKDGSNAIIMAKNL